MEAKTKLLEQIKAIDNVELINSISAMLAGLDKNGVFHLDNQLVIELDKRSSNIAKGQFVNHEDVFKRFSK